VVLAVLEAVSVVLFVENLEVDSLILLLTQEEALEEGTVLTLVHTLMVDQVLLLCVTQEHR
jgi:hypothetical protein